MDRGKVTQRIYQADSILAIWIGVNYLYTTNLEGQGLKVPLGGSPVLEKSAEGLKLEGSR